MFRHFLLPTDASDFATGAVRRGIALAKEVGAKVTLLSVVEPLHVLHTNPTSISQSLASLEAAAERELRTGLDALAAEAAAAGVTASVVVGRNESAASEIIETASREGCDLIVMATHGRRGFTRLMLGSQTERVVAGASVAVLVLR